MTEDELHSLRLVLEYRRSPLSVLVAPGCGFVTGLGLAATVIFVGWATKSFGDWRFWTVLAGVIFASIVIFVLIDRSERRADAEGRAPTARAYEDGTATVMRLQSEAVVVVKYPYPADSPWFTTPDYYYDAGNGELVALPCSDALESYIHNDVEIAFTCNGIRASPTMRRGGSLEPLRIIEGAAASELLQLRPGYWRPFKGRLDSLESDLRALAASQDQKLHIPPKVLKRA